MQCLKLNRQRKIHAQLKNNNTNTNSQTAEQQLITRNNLRLAKVLISFKVSLFSARAALRASSTHWAADINISEAGSTDSKPTKQRHQPIIKQETHIQPEKTLNEIVNQRQR